MYCAQFEDGDQHLAQALIEFPTLVVGAEGEGWRTRLSGLADLLAGTPAIDVAVRLTLEGRRFNRQVLLTSLQGDTAALDDLAQALMGLDDGSQRLVAECTDRARFDGVAEGLPAACVRLASPPLVIGDARIIDDRRLLPSLAGLGVMALSRGHKLCWQGVYRQLDATADEVRAVRKNALAIEHLPQVPSALRRAQHDLATRFDSAGLCVDECLWLDAAALTDANAAVAATEAVAAKAAGLPARTLTPLDDAEIEIARCALHPALFRAYSPIELAGCAVASSHLASALAFAAPATWNPDTLENAMRVDSAHDYLKRIDTRLESLERELLRRRTAADECAELRRALGIGREDPSFALVKARQILERVVRRLYALHRPAQGDKALLFDMIRDLTGQSGKPAVLPRRIGHYLDTIRVLGNLEAHGASGAGAPQLSRDDVELSLMMTLNVLEWFLLEREGSGPALTGA